MELAIIAALSKNKVIGKDGKMPWHIPGDLKNFRSLTLNHPTIMGRKTYESIPEKFRPLPNRTNIVLSGNPEFSREPTIIIARTIHEATQKAYDTGASRAYIIGGANIYKQFLPFTNRMFLTWIERQYEGDAYFPHFNEFEWKVVNWEQHDGFSFMEHERISPV